MVCAKVKPAVSGLQKEFPGQVRSQNVDATTPESKAAIKDLGFRTHGLVVRSETGTVLFKQPDHTVNLDEVRKAIRDLLKK